MVEFKSKPIQIICGPTASGKSIIAKQLAKKYPIEIVSADSRQIIKHLEIGTAKPTKEEQQQVKHHLIDIIEPGERYSAFRFINDANRSIADIISRDKIPLVVGGTGLYLNALTDGVVEILSEDMSIRQKLEDEMEQSGEEAMFAKLKSIDPLEAAKTHPNNKVRVIRGLEIFYLTGKTKSELVTTSTYKKSLYKFEYHCLIPDREFLYDSINKRVDVMIEKGWLIEIEQLVSNGLAEKLRKANVIGYNELLDYHEDKISFEEAISIIKQNTRRFAKRQITWFKNQIKGNFYNNLSEIPDLFVE